MLQSNLLLEQVTDSTDLKEAHDDLGTQQHDAVRGLVGFLCMERKIFKKGWKTNKQTS